MELTQEKFDAVKELSEISMQIAAARSTLSTLESGKDAFLDAQDQELIERIGLVLARSEAALRDIDQNHDALVKYRRELEEYNDCLRSFHERVTSMMDELRTYYRAEHENLNKRFVELESRENHMRNQKSLIDADRDSLKNKRMEVAEAMRVLEDRTALRERTEKRLPTKKK